MGPKIQWLQSYVTDDKIYCVYIAPDEATVREHATKGGFPANKVSRIRAMIDPTTSDRRASLLRLLQQIKLSASFDVGRSVSPVGKPFSLSR